MTEGCSVEYLRVHHDYTRNGEHASLELELVKMS